MSDDAISRVRAGWFGKLPALGDFVRDGLPDNFVNPWDDWLRRGMAAGEARFGDAWHDLFLRFPVWHFLRRGDASCTPGVWAGVLVPGADRVGRLFPFTVAFCVPEPVLLASGPDPVETRLTQITSHVLTLLGDDDLRAFAQNMAATVPQEELEASADLPATGCHTPSGLVQHLGRQALLERLSGQTVFWTCNEQPAPLISVREPLDGAAFCQLVCPSSLPYAGD